MRGCVSKRGNKFCYVVEYGRHPVTGKRRQKSCSGFDTRLEAEKELARVLNELDEFRYVPPSKETIEDYLYGTWLPKKRQEVRPGTHVTYSWTVRMHIVPHVGKLLLDQLTPQRILQLYDRLLTTSNLSPQSVKHTHRVLHDCYETAVKFGLVRQNPVSLIKAPKVPRKEMKVWTEKQVNLFLEANKHTRLYIVYLLAITTGLRQGELLGLHWTDLDLDDAKLMVKRSYSRHSKFFQEPKTVAGFRTVTLPKQTVNGLREHLLQQEKDSQKVGELYEDKGLVITTLHGKTPNIQQLHEAWQIAIKRAGVPRIRFHDLRHTHTSLLVKYGINIKVISERLGHSNITITLDRYSHLLPGMQEEAADKMDELLTSAAEALPTVHS